MVDFKLWSTSITRFNAAKRISSWKHCIRWSLLASSIYLTILSILIYAGKIQESHSEITQFGTIFLSILTLCLSLSVNLNQLEIKAFYYHECGRKIRRLLSELSATEDHSKINSILTKYDDILDKYENHMSIDYYQFVLHNYNKFSDEQKLKTTPLYLVYLWMPAARYIPQLFVYAITVILPIKLILQIVKF